jgi:hypothetical protein
VDPSPWLSTKLPQEVLRPAQLIVEDLAGDAEKVADELIADGIANADSLFLADHDVAGSQDT